MVVVSKRNDLAQYLFHNNIKAHFTGLQFDTVHLWGILTNPTAPEMFVRLAVAALK